MFVEISTRFIAYLAIFLFGLIVMRHGLYQLAQARLQGWLTNLTNSAWKGMLIGMLITAILQSSTAVMVMLVGLVAARMIPFTHTIGVILGANIGTTITAELITFQLDSYALWILAIGMILLLIRHTLTYSIGNLFIGLACLFLSMSGFSSLAEPIAAFPAARDLFHWASTYSVNGMLLGAILAAIIQSSTACIAIAMGFLEEMSISLPTAIAIMIGSNIGTCLTALIASIGTNSAAKKVAFANVWVNTLGALCFLPLINGLATFSTMLSDHPSVQLAHASVLFNVICSMVLLPLVKPFTRFIEFVHRKL